MSNGRRPSLLGALIWIAFGVLFLLRNFDIGLGFWSLAGRYWPVLLILLGLGKVIDYFLKKDAFSIRIGEIIGILLLLAAGSAITKISESSLGRFIRELPIEIGDSSIKPGQWIGDSHTYSEEATYPLDHPRPVRIENSYGLVSVAPGSDREVHVRLKKTVFGGEARARELASQVRLEAGPASRPAATAAPEAEPGKTPGTDWFVVKTNRESLGSPERMFNTDLEVLIPKNSRLEVVNSFGEVKASEIAGSIDLTTTHRALEVRDCAGSFKISNRYGESRLTNLKGSVAFTGRGKAYLENINGDVTVTNEFSPLEIYNVEGKVSVSATENRVRVEKVTGPVTIDARGARVNAGNLKDSLKLTASHERADIHDVASDVRIESRYVSLALKDIRGNIEINSNSDRVSARDIGGSFKIRARASGVRLDAVKGPVDIRTTLKDVVVNDAADNCSITNEYADVSVSAQRLGKGGMDIRNRNGAIDLGLPEGASFIIDATAQNGRIESDYPGLETAGKEGSSAVLKSQVRGGGPRIVLEALYDNIRITRGLAGQRPPSRPSKRGKTIADLKLRLCDGQFKLLQGLPGRFEAK